MSLIHRKPISGADETALMRAASGKKWSRVRRMLAGSSFDRSTLDHVLLMAVLARQHQTVETALQSGADPAAMNGRIPVEAAANADLKSLRLLFARQPAIVKYAERARNAAFAPWADMPGGDGTAYQPVIRFLDKIIARKTSIIARARRRPH